jgi:hypothetical protein
LREFRVFVRRFAFDVAFDDAAPEVLGSGGVCGLPFVVFADIYQACARALALLGFTDLLIGSLIDLSNE